MVMQPREFGAQLVNCVFEILPIRIADHKKSRYTSKSEHVPSSSQNSAKSSRAILLGIALLVSNPSGIL